MDSDTIYQQVQDCYSSTARAQKLAHSDTIAQAFGYTAEELNSIPSDANLGLSCGNPLAIASLQEVSSFASLCLLCCILAANQFMIKKGETVVDLGSGAGFDVFLAAKKVGTIGRAIGVDMNEVQSAYCYLSLYLVVLTYLI